MKRKDLVKKLENGGFQFERHGGGMISMWEEKNENVFHVTQR
mgnify:CR=1 FL=1